MSDTLKANLKAWALIMPILAYLLFMASLSGCARRGYMEVKRTITERIEIEGGGVPIQPGPRDVKEQGFRKASE